MTYVIDILANTFINYRQGRPVNVRHDIRCIVGKVGGQKKTKRGGNLTYCYKKLNITVLLHNKMLQNSRTAICSTCYLLLSFGHRSLL